MAKYHLISSVTCPWVQRAAIVLRAKKVDYQITYVNLSDKPDWFLKVSPHGKVPVLVVDEQPLFESNAIAEFLDEMEAPKLHPDNVIKRARNRAWCDFVPDFAKTMSAFYYAKDKAELDSALADAPKKLQRLERALTEERGNDGPYFNGPQLSIVDASYAPFFQRFGYMDDVLHTGLLDKFPKVKAWVATLMKDPAVQASTIANFRDEFVANLKRRKLWAAELFDGRSVAAAE
jgi:glutathione S-transferase